MISDELQSAIRRRTSGPRAIGMGRCTSPLLSRHLPWDRAEANRAPLPNIGKVSWSPIAWLAVRRWALSHLTRSP